MVEEKKISVEVNQSVDDADLQSRIDAAVDQKVNERMEEFKRNFENMIGGGLPHQTRLGPVRETQHPRTDYSNNPKPDPYTDAEGNPYLELDPYDLSVENRQKFAELKDQLERGKPQKAKTPKAQAQETLKIHNRLVKEMQSTFKKQEKKINRNYQKDLAKYKSRIDRIDKYFATTGMPHKAQFLYEFMDLAFQDGEFSEAHQYMQELEQIMNEDAYGKGPIGYLDTKMKRTSPKTFLDASGTNDPDPGTETFGYFFDPNLGEGGGFVRGRHGKTPIAGFHGPRKHKGSQYEGILGWLESHGKAYGAFKIVSKAGMANLNPYGFMGYVLGLLTRKGPVGAALAFGITGAWVAPHLAANVIQIMGHKGHPLNRDFVKLTDEHTYGLWSLQEEKRRLLGHDAYVVTQTDRYEPQSGSTTFNSLENRDNVIMSKIGLAEKALGVTYQGWT